MCNSNKLFSNVKHDRFVITAHQLYFTQSKNMHTQLLLPVPKQFSEIIFICAILVGRCVNICVITFENIHYYSQ